MNSSEWFAAAKFGAAGSGILTNFATAMRGRDDRHNRNDTDFSLIFNGQTVVAFVKSDPSKQHDGSARFGPNCRYL
jgi:hypothetical protein